MADSSLSHRKSHRPSETRPPRVSLRRPTASRPGWGARWREGGQQRERAFRTREEAEAFAAEVSGGRAVVDANRERRTLYAIQCGVDGPVKIGITGKLGARMSQLQSASHERLLLVGVGEGDARDEADLHKALGDERIRGEWYRCSPRVIEAIEHIRGASA